MLYSLTILCPTVKEGSIDHLFTLDLSVHENKEDFLVSFFPVRHNIQWPPHQVLKERNERKSNEPQIISLTPWQLSSVPKVTIESN